ncbi:MAG: hypothetical protein GOVbin52_43 [Prokaryotic dsDNA virus sp.]|nr:MAG: hypothetical protein GOVbin52_43 [Prokaryotic dsDNA virus sp.]HBX94994.1 hypothetical protein [Hyphomonas sp.]|tara:strand:+ start:18334 stop:18765 length:432 start_codon:yes stop_codon:yes gene_type:complete
MAKRRFELISFNGGEIGVRSLGRIDLASYARCAETMENVFITPQGELSKAPGTVYIGTAKSGEETVLLRSFEYAVDDNLLMVFSDTNMQLITDDAFVTIDGAAATIGTFSDQSSAPSTGGGAAPTPTTEIEYNYDGVFTGVYA